MGIIGGRLGYWILRAISPQGVRGGCGAEPQETTSKLDLFFPAEFWSDVVGKTVADFGCGDGTEAVELARRGAMRVVGIDIRESCLTAAREAAAHHGVSDRCIFTAAPGEIACVDTVVSVDAFEHFEDPRAILQIMNTILVPNGVVWAVFGPPWLHPYGGHLFSVFPWAHLVFTEHALIRWRSDFKTDGAQRFSEVEGGLNQMTIKRFEQTVRASPFRFDRFDLLPIRRLRWLHNRVTREFLTSSVRCRLIAGP